MAAVGVDLMASAVTDNPKAGEEPRYPSAHPCSQALWSLDARSRSSWTRLVQRLFGRGGSLPADLRRGERRLTGGSSPEVGAPLPLGGTDRLRSVPATGITVAGRFEMSGEPGCELVTALSPILDIGDRSPVGYEVLRVAVGWSSRCGRRLRESAQAGVPREPRSLLLLRATR